MIVFLSLVWLASIIGCLWLADKYQLGSPVRAFILGFLLGPIGLGIYLLDGPIEAKDQREAAARHKTATD